MENGLASQKIETRHFYYFQVKLSPWSLSLTPRPRQITHSPYLRGRTMKTYLKMYCFKLTFLKLVLEECTFSWKVLSVTLSKHQLATITEVLSLFANVIINI